ncbi:hypothetical protein [Amycolatopsis sp. NPDC051061]
MEDVTAAVLVPAPDPDFDAMLAVALGHSRAVEEAHDFDHLLQARP